jgi:hypothetical protein
VVQAALAFEAAELERLAQIQLTLKCFCDIEQQSNSVRTKLLTKLATAVDGVDPKADLRAFIRREKNNECTYKHTRALALLDWDYHRKM